MFTNYKYVTDGKTYVSAISTYAGQEVKGTAKCAPADKFDFTKGAKLAAARCEYRVSLKRNKRAKRKVKEMRALLKETSNKSQKAEIYCKDSYTAVDIAKRNLATVLGEVLYD